jgi:lysophospholipase L1-like esterase
VLLESISTFRKLTVCVTRMVISLLPDKNGPIATETARQPISGKRRTSIYKVLLSLAGLLISLLVAEGALRLVEKTQVGDRAIENKLIKDPVLGLKLAPYTQGHDANGFRNDTVSQHVDIVALGDSQTWGVNVERQDAWPQELSKISGCSVYNMALGGFGPVQYRVLTPEALRLSPKIIVVGFYLGNDIYDAYKMAYQYEAHRGLQSSSGLRDLSVDTVGIRANSFWNEEKQFHANFGRSSLSGWSFWLREHLALGRLLNRTRLWPGSQDIDYEIDKRWAMAYPDRGAVCEEPGRETVLTTAYRLTGLDIDEPRNAEGLRIAKELLAQMQHEVDAKHVKLMILLLPTKETVYATAQSGKRGGKIGSDPTYEKLVEMEGRIRSEMISTCQTERIQCIDALPYLSSALDRGERLYPTTTESHPNARGYLVIASAVNENLGKLGP